MGTWSFSLGSEAVRCLTGLSALLTLRTERAVGNDRTMFILVRLRIYPTVNRGKETITRKIKEIHLKSAETLALSIGLILMLAGAVVESVAINSL